MANTTGDKGPPSAADVPGSEAMTGGPSVKSLGVMTAAKSNPQGGPEIQIGPGSKDWERGRAPAKAGYSIPVSGLKPGKR